MEPEKASVHSYLLKRVGANDQGLNECLMHSIHQTMRPDFRSWFSLITAAYVA